jgi:hypothetical protein
MNRFSGIQHLAGQSAPINVNASDSPTNAAPADAILPEELLQAKENFVFFADASVDKETPKVV